MWLITRERVERCTSPSCGNLAGDDGGERTFRSSPELDSLLASVTRVCNRSVTFTGGVYEDLRTVPAECGDWSSYEEPEGGWVYTEGVVWRLYRLDRQ